MLIVFVIFEGKKGTIYCTYSSILPICAVKLKIVSEYMCNCAYISVNSNYKKQNTMKLFAGLTILFILTSCNFIGNKYDKSLNELPKVQGLENFKQTEFVTTLENSISTNKNSIYVPTFLYAWDEVKEKLKCDVIINDSNSNEFKILNISKSHINSLTEDEYSAIAEIDDGVITAKAFFKMTLPFETKLQALKEPIVFGKTKVSAFGMYYYDEKAVKFTNIL